MSQDDFPIPITKLLVEAITGYVALSFMDGFLSYNQIKMDPEEEDLTTFQTPQSIYCYMVMLSGLKNVGAIYQIAMQIYFSWLRL